jgi:hypothetical protein
MTRIATFCCIFALLGCSKTHDSGRSGFARCWKFQPLASELYKTDFVAVIYPRNGAIAYDDDCPNLRLAMNFAGVAPPPGFQGFEEARHSPSKLIAFRGTAVIRVDRPISPTTLSVVVDRLDKAKLLSPVESDELVAKMRKPR